MTNFVVGDQTLAPTICQRTTFHSSDDPVNGVIDFRETDRLLATASREDGSLVHQVGQIGTGETRRATGNAFEGEIRFELLVAAVDFQNGKATLDVRGIDSDLTIEPTRTHQG